MKIKKILASVLLTVTLFNVGGISHATEPTVLSKVKVEEKSDITLADLSSLLNQLEKENRISEKQNQKLQKEINNLELNEIKKEKKWLEICRFIKGKVFAGIVWMSLLVYYLTDSAICCVFFGAMLGAPISCVIGAIEAASMS